MRRLTLDKPGRRALFAAFAAAMSLTAAPAAAQDGGVFVDPDSPSGKEYALPLDTARRQADPGRDPGAPVRIGSRSSQLFGEGVVSATSRRPRATTAAGQTGRSKSTDRAPVSAGSPADQNAVRLATMRPGTPDGGAGTKLLIAGVAVLVLSVGGLAGYAARRGARES